MDNESSYCTLLVAMVTDLHETVICDRSPAKLQVIIMTVTFEPSANSLPINSNYQGSDSLFTWT